MPGPLGDRAEAWPVLESADVHRDHWVVALRRDLVRRPGAWDEAPFHRIVVEHPGAVVVLAMDDEDRVFCLAQYRHAAQRRFVELPAGLCDVAGEDPVEVARRELQEEALLAAREWTHLLSTYSSPGISDEIVHLYLARGLTPVDRGDFVPEHEEADMETFWAPYDALRDAVLDGRVADAPVALAVLAVEALGLVPNRRGRE